MVRQLDRIDGWKAIGAYFGRDRTTAIRWHKQRGLPVRHIPGGKTRTVYALKIELDAWAAASILSEPCDVIPLPIGPPTAEDIGVPANRDEAPGPAAVIPIGAGGTRSDEQGVPRPTDPAPAPAKTPETGPDTAQTSRLRVWGGAMIAAIIIAISSLYFAWPHHSPDLAIPGNDKAAAAYVAARDNLAKRTSATIATAIAEFKEVNRLAPTFAPAFSGLADAYLLAREFGSLTDDEAFPPALIAAERAKALDGALAPAYRADGFIDYWWKHDRAAAAAAFQQALALDESDAQTHLWYANMLADNGEAAAAARHFRAAKLLAPGSLAISTDEAWAVWSDGQDALAEQLLENLVAEWPNFATPHDCLSMVALGRGDLNGYAVELGNRAALRKEPALSAYSDAISAAMARHDRASLKRAMLGRAGSLQIHAPRGDPALAAFFLSALGDRDGLLRLLADADRRGEFWGAAGFRRHIAARWHGDATVLDLLARRQPPLLESSKD